MRVSDQFELNMTREQAFQYINNAELLAGCIPGCSNLEEIEPNCFNAILEVEVAFLKLKFNVQVHLEEVQEPSLLRAGINGKPVGLPGKLSATAELLLEETEDSAGTLITYMLDQSITGKLGGIGQSVFRAKSEEQGKLFASNLKSALEKLTLGVK